MKHIYAAILCAAFASTAIAQNCNDDRYRTELFSGHTVVPAVPFGSNTAVAGGNQTLRMDVYMPAGDTLTSRPVVIVAFGGSFIAGTRADVADLCIRFAKMGYVAVAPDYRVGFFFPNQASTTRAVLRGAHDMKACIRYLRRSVAELDNPYGIDPDKIIAGGVSAGAISAIHATYLDQPEEIPPILAGEIAGIGGVEGNSGNPGYSSAVLGCLSFSGAIGDTTWINAGDPPLVSVHDIGDGVVPYYTQEVSVVGLPTGLVASGSHDVHLRCQNAGLINCLKSYPGSGHVAYLGADPVVSVAFAATFCSELICNEESTCGAFITAVRPIDTPGAFQVFPNPTANSIQFVMEAPGPIRLLDLSGREVMRTRGVLGTTTLDLSGMHDGVYLLHVQDPVDRFVRVIKAQ